MKILKIINIPETFELKFWFSLYRKVLIDNKIDFDWVFSLNMSLETVFRVYNELGFACKNYFSILGAHIYKKTYNRPNLVFNNLNIEIMVNTGKYFFPNILNILSK